jgi:hypothetical protein
MGDSPAGKPVWRSRTLIPPASGSRVISTVEELAGTAWPSPS